MNDFLEKIKREISSTVGVDFDGVIHKNSKGFHDGTIYDEPLPGTKEALKQLSEKYRLVIYTCKARQDRPLVNGMSGIMLIWEWLENHGLDQYISDVTNKKPRALFYIDDKAIRFDSWAQVLVDIYDLSINNTEDLSKF